MYVRTSPAPTLFETNIKWKIINHLEICNHIYEDSYTTTEEVTNNLSVGINAIIYNEEKPS